MGTLTSAGTDASRASAAESASLCKGPKDAQGTYILQCFSPAKRRRAEALLPFAPVHPDAAVAGVAHLQLRQVALTRVVTASGRSGRATKISYVYGTLPQGPDGVPEIIGPGLGNYVIVDELAGTYPNFTHFGLVREQNEGTLWEAHAAFRCRRADLSVTSDLPKRQVRGIARAILRSEAYPIDVRVGSCAGR